MPEAKHRIWDYHLAAIQDLKIRYVTRIACHMLTESTWNGKASYIDCQVNLIIFHDYKSGQHLLAGYCIIQSSVISQHCMWLWVSVDYL